MSQEVLSEVVRRVEDSPLEDLLRVSIDEVQVQMDSYLDPEVDSASLYRRWEKQQWAVSDLDFTPDVRQWESIPEGSRETIRRTMTLFFIGEQAVTDTLGPILHAAPYEDERVQSRHIGFGVLALQRRVQEDPEMARVIALKVLDLLEPCALTAINPDTRLNLPDPGSMPPQLRQSPLELREFAIGSLGKRLRSVGLSDSAVDDLGREMRQIYEQLWNRYEQVHGVDHPVRWYQRHGLEASA